MSSETSDPADDCVDVSTRSCPIKKNSGKVPRKIHKAEREKLKRDHLNELFLDLGKALDHPNNGKASILRDTVLLLGELLTQVDTLKKENVALLSESNYVTVEKNDLLEETSTLEDQIKRLQSDIEEKSGRSSNTYIPNASTQLQEEGVQFPIAGHASDPGSIMGPVFVMPFHHEPAPENVPKVLSSVSRPRPRYPSSSDIWPPPHILNPTSVTEDV